LDPYGSNHALKRDISSRLKILDPDRHPTSAAPWPTRAGIQNALFDSCPDGAQHFHFCKTAKTMGNPMGQHNGDMNGHPTNGNSNSDDHDYESPLIGDDTALTYDSIPSHPLGVKPLGNEFIATGPKARDSLGAMQALPDETLMILLEYLDQFSLWRLGYTCRFLYAFCRSDDLWKSLFIE
jgi:hypothetical protein